MSDKGIIRLLKEIAELAQEATLTGSMEGGTVRTIQRYNATLATLQERGTVPKGLFAPLPETANYGEVGVEAKMLVGFLKGEGNDDEGHHKPKGGRADISILTRLAPFVDSHDLGALIAQYSAQNMSLDPDTLAQLAPFLDRGTLGQLIQKHMIPHLRPAEAADAPEEPPAAPAPAPAPTPVPPAPQQDTVAELVAKLQSGDLSEERRQQVLARLAELTR